MKFILNSSLITGSKITIEDKNKMLKPIIIAFDFSEADYSQNKEFLDKADALLEE